MTRSLRSHGSVALPVLILVALAGCGPHGATSSAGGGTIQLADPGPAAETVNGEAVPTRLIDALMRQRGWDTSRQDLRERAMKDVASIVVIAQAARKENLLADGDFAAVIELGRLQALSNATVAALRDRATVDDAALRDDYDKKIARMGKPDYDFTQIVLRTQPDAAKVIAEAKSKPFDKVVEAHQKDALQSRSLKRVRSAQLPEPMAKALDALKPGEISKDPVQIPLGWVVFRLDAVTPYTPPPFEQLKDNLRHQAQKRAGEDQVSKYRAEAKIVPASPSPQPAGKPADKPADKPAADAAKPKS
jgi:peptidyl-prolyl cis-trans isomerase C